MTDEQTSEKNEDNSGEEPTVDAEIRQVSGMTLAGRAGSNHWVIMDGKKKFGGEEGGSSPMELVLLALGGCTSMDVISLLRKMRIPYDDFRLTMNTKRSDEHPKVYTDIVLHYHFYGEDFPMPKLEKIVGLSQERYCSVTAMLMKAVNITNEIHTHDVD